MRDPESQARQQDERESNAIATADACARERERAAVKVDQFVKDRGFALTQKQEGSSHLPPYFLIGTEVSSHQCYRALLTAAATHWLHCGGSWDGEHASWLLSWLREQGEASNASQDQPIVLRASREDKPCSQRTRGKNLGHLKGEGEAAKERARVVSDAADRRVKSESLSRCAIHFVWQWIVLRLGAADAQCVQRCLARERCDASKTEAN
jgi:hypothetical protein